MFINLQSHVAIRKSILQALQEVFVSLEPLIDEANDQKPLREQLGSQYDSLRVLECVGAIEDVFKIDIDIIDDDLLRTFQSVSTIQELVELKLADIQALE